jgi:hypothetical protein
MRMVPKSGNRFSGKIMRGIEVHAIVKVQR